MRRDGWQFLDTEARERFLLEWLPEFEELFDLLTDFRFGGYRVLWDILLDIDQENTAQDRKRLVRDGDSPAFATMMEAYQKERPLPVLPGRRLRQVPGAAGHNRETCDRCAVCGGSGQAWAAVGTAAGRRSAQRVGGAHAE